MLVIKLCLLSHTSSNTCTVLYNCHWEAESVFANTNLTFILHNTFLVHANAEHIMFLECTIRLSSNKIK